MPDYGSILEMMGYNYPSLEAMFKGERGRSDPLWERELGRSFGSYQTAMGDLPGLRRGMLGQLTSGLQERGIAARRGIQARRAGAGFAGAGALDRMGRTARRGLEKEYGRGMWGIGQDIAGREASLLATLLGQTQEYLGGIEPVRGTGRDPRYWGEKPEEWTSTGEWMGPQGRQPLGGFLREYLPRGEEITPMTFEEFLESSGMSGSQAEYAYNEYLRIVSA